MFEEEFPADLVLEALDDMSQSKDNSTKIQHRRPKVILFDIGGVCVISPFQSILDYELNLGIPPGWVNFSISKTAPDGFWHRLETGHIPMDDDFFIGFARDLHDPVRWATFYKEQQAKNPNLPKTIPPVPKIDARWLFFDMMAGARAPDPWMFPALKKLRASGKFLIAALSNTVIFPPDHPYNQIKIEDDPIRSLFDVFISSAHVGLRKPNPKIYQLALEKVDEFARENAGTGRGKALGWEDGVQAGDILFLDDIGENLKAAKKLGFETIKVSLGRAFEAVEELEEVTGLELAGDHPKIPIKPNYKKAKAKI